MEVSTPFKTTIKEYLEHRAKNDELFAEAFAKPDKNIDECITYILNTVQKSICNGFTDDEIYSMAVHYYDEDDIEVGKSIVCKVVVNHTIELTEEEKTEARREAVKRVEQEAYAKIEQQKKKGMAKRSTTTQDSQLSLFNF